MNNTCIAQPSAAEYVASGLVLVEIPAGKKRPIRRGWNLRKNCISTPEQAARLNTHNIGLAHAYSHTCAVDIDQYDKAVDWFAGRSIDLLALLTAEGAVQIKSGRLNKAKLLYRLPFCLKPL
ncbi:MAG: bifunctional DNA primase/polymerase, partial [Gammaproteobacteria bacterium]